MTREELVSTTFGFIPQILKIPERKEVEVLTTLVPPTVH